MKKNFVIQIDGPLKERGRPKNSWMEVVIIDPSKYNIFEYLAQVG